VAVAGDVGSLLFAVGVGCKLRSRGSFCFLCILLTCVQTDSEYIVIKQYVDQDLQDRLFEHTRMLKERKMITGPVERDVVTMLKVRDRSKDQMFLVRKKSRSPGRKT
jgi:hypothetical protein